MIYLRGMMMTDRSKLGIVMLIAALALGVLGDLLLRARPWGLNILIWAAALVGVVIFIVRWRRVAFNGHGRWLAAPVLFFAAAIAWRDSPVLTALNFLALGLSLALALLRAQSGHLLLAGVMEYALSILIAAFNTIAGAARLVLNDIQWREVPHKGVGFLLKSVTRGLAIAIPMLLIFGGLLAAADAAFSDIIMRLLDWDLTSIITHFLVIGCITWVVGGFLRGMLLGKEIAIAAGERPQGLYLGITETGIVLGLLDALFLSFVVVQFKYFFGGATRVQTVAGLTYAEYARSGFFELVSVAALVLPLLLLAHWLLRKDNPHHEQVFRVFAGVTVISLYVIIISAMQRMRIYQREYGLTELRVYTSAFMGWLALVFCWFLLTVLCGKRERFAFGAVVMGFFMMIGLMITNPDRLIVSTNVERANAGRLFDADYAGSLSADAVPGIIALLPKLDQQQRCALAARLLQHLNEETVTDWRHWNWSRAEAKRVLRENEHSLRSMACPQIQASNLER